MDKTNGEHPFGDMGQILALIVFMGVWITDSFIFHMSTFLSNEIHFYIRLSIMAGMLITAFYLFCSGHQVVPRIKKTEDLITTDAFRYVRHPLYLASLATYFSLSISTVSLLSMTILVGIFIFHDYIATYEEKLLEIKYGYVYTQYKEKTGKWTPKIIGARS